MTTAENILANAPDKQENIILHWVRTEFTLPDSIKQLCDMYFLKVWDGKFIIDSAKDGVINISNAAWIVHWQSTPEVAETAEEVACSFRMYRGKKYVVIKVWK